MKSKNIMIFRIVSAVLLISVMVLIFILSAETADESSDTSGSLIAAVISFFTPDWESLSEIQRAQLIAPFQFFVRKSAHFTIYAVLGMCSFLTFITYKKIPFKLRLAIICGVCLLYSVSDEMHQLFVPGRSGELRDICVDFSGSLAGILFFTLLSRIKFIKKYIL